MVALKPIRSHHPMQPGGTSSVVKVVRRRSRKLASLPNMPYDIVVEILGHLGPNDLLRLARTSKDWRRSLMSRSSEGIWQLARSRLEDMPDLPPGMSEPQYANLMFSTHCHYCFAPRVQLVIWKTLCRACKLCFPLYYKRSGSLQYNLEYYRLPMAAWKLVELQGNIIRSGTYAPITSRDRPRKIASLELLEKLAKEYSTVEGQPDQVQHWLKQQEEEHERWTRITDALEAWHELQRQKRSEELEGVRQKRMDKVVQKLEELGWREEIALMDIDRLRSHEKVHVARELTESAWTNIAPVLSQFMDGVKAERLEKLLIQQITSRRQLFSDYITELEQEISSVTPGYTFATPVTDLSLIPAVRDIIEGTPAEQTITKEAFKPIREQLGKMSLGWLAYQSRDLLRIMPRSSTDPSNDQISRLLLATTFFKCEYIRDPMPYPAIFTHPGTSSYIPWRIYPKPEEQRLFEDFRQEFWNYHKNRLSFHHQASQAAQCLVEMCGLDPAVTTAKDMDALNPIIRCVSCPAPGNPMNCALIMTWRRAIIHAVEHSDRTSEPIWVLLPANIQADWYREALDRAQAEIPVYRCYLCNECHDVDSIWPHLLSKHRPYVYKRVRLTPDPPSAFWLSSPIINY